MISSSLFLVLDAWLIAPFRWFDASQASFFLGLVLLAMQCVGVGQCCLWLVDRCHRHKRQMYDAEAARRTDLAMQALQLQDKTAYLAQNTLAKDAYGQSMSLAVGRMTASLWPALLALAWLDLRFHDVPLALPFSVPGLGDSVLYPFYFIPLYICCRVAWARLRESYLHPPVDNARFLSHTDPQ